MKVGIYLGQEYRVLSDFMVAELRRDNVGCINLEACVCRLDGNLKDLDVAIFNPDCLRGDSCGNSLISVAEKFPDTKFVVFKLNYGEKDVLVGEGSNIHFLNYSQMGKFILDPLNYSFGKNGGDGRES